MTYLLFLRNVYRFGLTPISGHGNMIQMILTVKLIGFAFEKNTVMTKIIDTEKKGEKVELTGVEKSLKDSNIVEVFHYCFNYIGLLTGNNILKTTFTLFN